VKHPVFQYECPHGLSMLVTCLDCIELQIEADVDQWNIEHGVLTWEGEGGRPLEEECQ
jgi:hypothetical protein